jgi:hypothetical protein
MIGIASSGRLCPIDWAVAMATQVYPVNTNLTWVHVVGAAIDAARERVVQEAKERKVKYLWFVDDDTVPPKNAARHLMYLLDQNGPPFGKVMVAGGIYCVKQDPPTPNVFMGPGEGPFWNWKVGDTFKCWGMGTGCMMINTQVFDHIEPPYFKTTSDDGFSQTDDLYFCQKVHDAGFEVMAHGGILCPHWDVVSVPNKVYTLPESSYPRLPKAEAVQEGVEV